MTGTQTPSQLKPWMKYWGDELPNTNNLECTVYDYLCENTKGHENELAIEYLTTRIRYGELLANIEDTTKAFVRLGVKAGDIVTFCTVTTPEIVYAFYALNKLGATLNMTDPRTSVNGLRDYIEEVGSTLVVCIDQAYEKIKEAVKGTAAKTVLVVSPVDSCHKPTQAAYKLTTKIPAFGKEVVRWPDFMEAARKDSAVPTIAYDKDRAILIMHTGGTTGRPKGVLLGDLAMNALVVQFTLQRFTGRQERMLDVMPPFIAYGYGVGVHGPLCGGAQLIIVPKFDPDKLGRLLLKYKPNHMAGVPLHYRNLIHDKHMKHADLSFLISAGAGGDGITVQDEDAVNNFFAKHNSPYDLCKGYGMTEVNATGTACIRRINRRGSVGIPFFMTNAGIFKPDTDEELGFNTEGEICFSTPTVMLGYYNMPEETARVLKTHSDGSVWVHTGDIGRMDEDGFIYVLNRIKRLIIRHDGFKVFPFAIEDRIKDVPGVGDCCAVAHKDPTHEQGQLPFVFVRPSGDYTGTTKELEQAIRQACAADLAEYIQPAGYCFIDQLPYTGIGKVDYMKLTKEAAEIPLNIDKVL